MEIALPVAALAGAVLLIRLGWGGRRYLAGAGWAVAALAAGSLTVTGGAWGLATAITAGSVFALIAVLQAGAVSPRRALRKAAAAPAVALPGGPEGIARRVSVFLAVVPLSFLAAQWLAYAVNTAMKGGAPLDANSVATMLFVQPVVWTLLMAWQMTLRGPRAMLIAPALAAALATALWSLS